MTPFYLKEWKDMRFTKTQVQKLTNKSYKKGRRRAFGFYFISFVFGTVFGIGGTILYLENQTQVNSFWNNDVKSFWNGL